jgi:hypothetical protein
MDRARSINGEERNVYRILVRKPKGKRPLGRSRRRGWTILKWILERQNGVVWTESIWFRIGTDVTIDWLYSYHICVYCRPMSDPWLYKWQNSFKAVVSSCRGRNTRRSKQGKFKVGYEELTCD